MWSGVTNAKGRPPTSDYKLTTTYFEGWRNEAVLVIAGIDADKKAYATAEALLSRQRRMLTSMGLSDYTEVNIEVLGAGTHVWSPSTGTGLEKLCSRCPPSIREESSRAFCARIRLVRNINVSRRCP